MATLLDNDQYGCLGLTLHAMLEHDFGPTNFNIGVYQKAYVIYLRKHRDLIGQYTAAALTFDHTKMTEIITDIYRTVTSCMHRFVVHVFDNKNYVNEKMKELVEERCLRSPSSMVEAIKNYFFCDEDELKDLDQAVKNLHEDAYIIAYTGHTMDDDMAVMIFYLCDF